MSDQKAGEEVIDLRFGCASLSSGNLNYHPSSFLFLNILNNNFYFFIIKSGSDLNEFVTTTVMDDVFSFIDKKVVNPVVYDENNDDEDLFGSIGGDKFITLDREVFVDEITNIKDIQEKILLEEGPDSAWLKKD
jgi:hypothetical protein